MTFHYEAEHGRTGCDKAIESWDGSVEGWVRLNTTYSSAMINCEGCKRAREARKVREQRIAAEGWYCEGTAADWSLYSNLTTGSYGKTQESMAARLSARLTRIVRSQMKRHGQTLGGAQKAYEAMYKVLCGATYRKAGAADSEGRNYMAFQVAEAFGVSAYEIG